MEIDKKVLVVEDHPLVLYALTEILEMHGFKVFTTGNGFEAVEMARLHRPDLIVSNYSMPDLDGLGVLERIRSHPETAEIPFVFFSAHSLPSVREHCLQRGADAFVSKDGGPGELIGTMRQLLAQRKPHL